MSVHDYETAEKLLKSNKRFKRRRLTNNTWIERSTMNANRIMLIHHKTVIITYFKDGTVIFKNDGWGSKTTRERMDDFQNKINIFSQKKKWWYCIGCEWSAKYPFYEGLIIRPDGSIDEFNEEVDSQIKSENYGHLMGRQTY